MPPALSRELVGIVGGCVIVGMSSLWLWKRHKASQPTVTVIGDIFCDVIATSLRQLPSVWGTDTVISTPITVQSGGSGLNTAVWLNSVIAAHALKKPPTVQISINFREDGEFESLVRDKLSDSGVVQIAPIDSSESAVGTCICLSGETDRSFVTYRGGNEKFGFSDYNFEDLVTQNQQHVHIAGYYNCPGLWGDKAVRFIGEARTKNPSLRVSLNPQYGQDWGGDIRKILSVIDFFICNSVEAQGIASIGLDKSLDIIESGIRLVKELNCPCAIITMGSDGALVVRKGLFQGEGMTEFPEAGVSLQRVLCKEILDSPIMDTVGVGDAFCGGFLAQVVEKRLNAASPELIEAVRFGCACGTAALTVVGGSTFPGLSKVHECMID